MIEKTPNRRGAVSKDHVPSRLHCGTGLTVLVLRRGWVRSQLGSGPKTPRSEEN